MGQHRRARPNDAAGWAAAGGRRRDRRHHQLSSRSDSVNVRPRVRAPAKSSWPTIHSSLRGNILANQPNSSALVCQRLHPISRSARTTQSISRVLLLLCGNWSGVSSPRIAARRQICCADSHSHQRPCSSGASFWLPNVSSPGQPLLLTAVRFFELARFRLVHRSGWLLVASLWVASPLPLNVPWLAAMELGCLTPIVLLGIVLFVQQRHRQLAMRRANKQSAPRDGEDRALGGFLTMPAMLLFVGSLHGMLASTELLSLAAGGDRVDRQCDCAGQSRRQRGVGVHRLRSGVALFAIGRARSAHLAGSEPRCMSTADRARSDCLVSRGAGDSRRRAAAAGRGRVRAA